MTSIAARFTLVLAELRVAVAAHAWRVGLRAVLFNLLATRLARMARRMQSLYAQWQSGRLPRPRPARPSKPRAPRERPSFPHRRAWLLHEAEIFRIAAVTARGRIEQLLAEPDFDAFIRAVPQAGRILRPLGHMLGMDLPPPLRLPPRKRTPRPRPSRPPTPERPKPPADHPIYPVGFRPYPFLKTA